MSRILRSAADDSPWIAVIDDDQSVRRSLARLLRAHGIHALCFASAEDYLERAFLGEPHCILLDVELPGGLNGPDLQDRLQDEGVCPPIVFMTGQDVIRPAFLKRWPELSGCLRKPFDMSRLLARVGPYLHTAAAAS
jgi:FixJ family two-component response regulator